LKSYRLLYITPGLKFENSAWWLHCFCVFWMDFRTNSNFCLLYHLRIGFYTRSGECLQRGTHWVLI